MIAQKYSRVNGSLKVCERAVHGTPTDFYVCAAGKSSDWVKGTPGVYERLERVFQSRNKEGFDALVDELIESHPYGSH